MTAYGIEIQVEPEFAQAVDPAWLERIVETVLTIEAQPPECGLALVITSDAGIQALNRMYLGVDRPTDVLSFPAAAESPSEDKATALIPFVMPEGMPPYLGDVVVSYPTALEQAQAQGQPVETELALLVVHGCLHLLGYDHADEDDRQQMWRRQDEILSRLT